MNSLDPIRLAVIEKQIDHICQQMGWIMTRTARSPIFSQSHDFTCFLASAEGEVIAQADGLPIHSGGGGYAIRALLKVYKDDIHDGDVFILSDPYVAGGNHLPDWTIIRPIILDGRLCAFAVNRAHQSDIGGGAAGTYNCEAREIFHEGIRLPPMRLIDRGQMRSDLFSLLMLNSRTPELTEGDVGAMIGSTKIGADRIKAILRDVGVDEGLAYFSGLLDHAEAMMRNAITALPEGCWVGIDGSNTDCFKEVDVPIKVTVTKIEDTLTFDFTGSSDQIAGFKNSSIANTFSSVFVAVATFFDSTIPHNEGALRPIKIVAPLGSVVNPRPPAPVTMCTTYPAHDIMHACWKALSQAMPERGCAGWSKQCYGNSSGQGADGRLFVLYHWHGSAGGGAVKGRDGFATIGNAPTLGGLTIPNVEGYEQAYPIRILKQEFRCDASGPGEFRGGAGVEYVCEMLVPTEHAVRAEGMGGPNGYGICGGLDGTIGTLSVLVEGEALSLPRFGIEHHPPCRIEVSSGGGGGWGDPLRRDPAAVRDDVQDGIVSAASALSAYGVVLTSSQELDVIATAETRRKRLAEPSSAYA